MAEGPPIQIGKNAAPELSVAELGERGCPREAIEEMVRRRVREKLAEADQLLRQIDERWAPPPFDPFLVAQALGIRCVPVAEPWLKEAMIFLQDGRPTILFRPERPRWRTCFNIFHEIAHTLFPDYLHNPLYWRPRRPRLFEPEGRLEYLCDVAAAEFLMPMDLFCQDLERGFGAARVEALCARYGATAEAVCLRMVESNLESCALVLIDQRRQPKRRQWKELSAFFDFPESQQRMRVTYSLPSARFRSQGLSIPAYLGLSRRNCIDRAARSKKPATGEERLELGRGQSQPFYIEALPLRSHPSRRGRAPVLAFFYPR